MSKRTHQLSTCGIPLLGENDWCNFLIQNKYRAEVGVSDSTLPTQSNDAIAQME